MLQFALNHMTAPSLRYDAFLAMAARLGCVGVELRNDLGRPLFDGDDPEAVRDEAARCGLRIVGLSQVYPFNAWSDAVRAEVAALIAQAQACGAETISLIPRNDGLPETDTERQAALRHALVEVLPMLEAAEMVALVEPLGFETSSLRCKTRAIEAIEAIEAIGADGRVRLVHDTFHHHLAGGGPIFADHTGIVHVSGVVDPGLPVSRMRDEHRVLVGRTDRLGNVAQIAELLAAGYDGPISFEAFAREIHALADPETALRDSIRHFERELAAAVG